jgi:hypothetical protein
MARLALTVYLLLGCTGIYSQSVPWASTTNHLQMSAEAIAPPQVTIPYAQEQVISINGEKKQKSKTTALFLSLALPGAGEIYTENYWRGAAFLALEATGWVFRGIYNQKGKDIDTKFKRFANIHWDENVYWAKVYDWVASDEDRIDAYLKDVDPYDGWVRDQEIPAGALRPEWVDGFIDYLQTNPDLLEKLYLAQNEFGSHELPRTKTQQYYEMIYKYGSQFGNAWSDANFYSNMEGKLTPISSEYRDMRDQSNDYYNIATNVTNAILINHIVSAIDAFWLAKQFNRSVELSYQPRMIENRMVNTYALAIHF